MSDPVLVAIDDAVATLTLNRPEQLNVIDAALARALRDAALTVELDQSVRAVVLRGAGEGFMAGGDIRLFNAHLGRDLDRVVRDITHDLHDAVIALRRMAKPLVTSVHGACAGAGFSLAMAGDLVICAEDSLFTLAYSTIGTSPDGASTFFLPRLVGLHRAMELVLLSERFDAARAAALGLVNRVVPADRLEAETQELARRLARGPTVAFGKAKALINQSLERGIAEQLHDEALNIAACTGTADFAEGVRAFLEKRPPHFTGR